jgi:hypothetical protein
MEKPSGQRHGDTDGALKQQVITRRFHWALAAPKITITANLQA